MGETEFEIFAIIANLIFLVFICGIIVFFLKYHKRKLMGEKEKAVLSEQHAMEMLSAKLEIQQQTMQDIGREIHDNVGQLLTVASLSAYQVVYDNECPVQNERVSNIGKIIDQSLDELRNLSKNLTNEQAEMTEVIELVQNECTRINKLNLCKIACNCNELDFTVSNAVKNFILRMVQEFIQNSLKHAACKNIALDFNYSEKGLSLHIEDDGKGFEIKTTGETKNSGIGLMNMKKRAAVIGADFSLHSVVNQGTSLDITISKNKLNLS